MYAYRISKKYAKEGEMNMEKDVVKELNFVEKIIVKIFKKTFIKVYNISRINAINAMLK